MRSIKFRGVLTSTQQWIIGDLYQDVYSGKTYITEFIGIESGESITELREVIPESVGQFTGLKDKNGADIYEGDIVCSFKKEYEDKPSKNIVEFIRGCFRLVCIGKNDIPLHNYSPHHLEIIGNIHDGREVETLTCGYCDSEFSKGTGGNYAEYGEVCANCYIGLS